MEIWRTTQNFSGAQSKALRSQTFIFLAAGILFFILFSHKALAQVRLVKTKSSPAVYYLNGETSRHAFPNAITYQSWYGDDFSRVVTVSEEFLAKIPLGKNITLLPGKYIAKIPTSPKVYAVETGGVLRHIENEGILEYFYGKNWIKRLVDIPEVFFHDYTLGEDIKSEYDVPNSILYKLANEKKYYWKIDDALHPFESLEAIRANGLSPDVAITSPRPYYSFTRPIQGASESIVNPTALPRKRNVDCENKNLKAGFIFVTENGFTLEQAELLEKMKKEFEKYYLWATWELSAIDLGYPTVTIENNKYFQYPEGKDKLLLDPNEVASVFYERNSDVFDFLFIFTNFRVLNHREQALFVPVSNRVLGNGRNMLEAQGIYGSQGKLKGIIIMDDVNRYSLDDSGKVHVMNLMMHEILHQWSGTIGFLAHNGKADFSLLRPEFEGKPDFEHWNFYVDFVSPLGGAGWKEESSGVFVSESSLSPNPLKKKLAEIDLYLMGLLPAQVVGTVGYIIPDNPNTFGNKILGKKFEVTIDDIVTANGKWMCNL